MSADEGHGGGAHVCPPFVGIGTDTPIVHSLVCAEIRPNVGFLGTHARRNGMLRDGLARHDGGWTGLRGSVTTYILGWEEINQRLAAHHPGFDGLPN
jgi:hypothetical protein